MCLCVGVNFQAESHDQKSFSKFENFTLSRNKVWILPICYNPNRIGLEARVLNNFIKRKNDDVIMMTDDCDI